MKLGKFIEQFSHNNIIRLQYKEKGGYRLVAEDWNDVSMDWQVLKGQGIFRHYINNEVLGLATILQRSGSYTEALNIVIEEWVDQPMIDEVKDDRSNCTESIEDNIVSRILNSISVIADAYDTNFTENIINGGKTDNTERASTICAYFDRNGYEKIVYEILESRYR